MLIVLISHFNLEKYVPGGFGVGIFFFISGFLITRLLLAEYQSFGIIRIPSFLARRVLRLYPPLIIMVALAFLLMIGRGIPLQWLAMSSSLFYFANYLRIFDAESLSLAALSHTWSLLVEEHST